MKLELKLTNYIKNKKGVEDYGKEMIMWQ